MLVNTKVVTLSMYYTKEEYCHVLYNKTKGRNIILKTSNYCSYTFNCH
jgi:hypothetical protein